MPDTTKSEPTRSAESKIIPPPNTEVKYPDVACIPPGQKSVVIIPKGPEVILPVKQDEVNPDGIRTVVTLPKE